MTTQRAELVHRAFAGWRRAGTFAVCIALTLTGCGQSSLPSGSKPPVASGSPPAGLAVRKSMSPAANRILSMLSEDKTEAARRLLNEFEDPSSGGAETEVLKAALLAAESFSPKAQVEELVLRVSPIAGLGQGGCVAQIRNRFKQAIDLDPKWKPVAGEVLMDLAVAQLQRRAGRGESVHCFGDTSLLSPRADYYGSEKGRNSAPLNGLVIGHLVSDLRASNADPSALLVTGLLRKQRAQNADFLVGGAWCGLFKLADEFAPGAVARRRAVLADIRTSFARRHLYTSAMLVERHAASTSPANQAQSYSLGLVLLAGYAAGATTPSAAQNLGIALGYWVEAHSTQAAAAPASREIARLLKTISARGAWCDAVVLAQHLGMPELELPPTVRSYPWRDQKANHEAFLATSAEKDPARLQQKLSALAELGHAEAMVELATLLELRDRDGKGNDQALNWLKKAWEAGWPEAAAQLGQIYEKGERTRADLPLALDYYRQAGNAGLPEGLADAARIYLNSWRTPEATNLFLALHRQAVAAGSAMAMNQLAIHNLAAKDAKSDAKAFELLQEAARRDCVAAQYNLGYCYFKGRGTTLDPVKGFQFTLLAATNGLPGAMFRAAVLYQDGTGTAPDLKLREYWLAKAYEAGDPDAVATYRNRQDQERQAFAARERSAHQRQQQAALGQAQQQARLVQQQQESEERQRQVMAQAQENAARAMRRWNQSVLGSFSAQGVNYWRTDPTRPGMRQLRP